MHDVAGTKLDIPHMMHEHCYCMRVCVLLHVKPTDHFADPLIILLRQGLSQGRRKTLVRSSLRFLLPSNFACRVSSSSLILSLFKV